MKGKTMLLMILVALVVVAALVIMNKGKSEIPPRQKRRPWWRWKRPIPRIPFVSANKFSSFSYILPAESQEDLLTSMHALWPPAFSRAAFYCSNGTWYIVPVKNPT